MVSVVEELGEKENSPRGPNPPSSLGFHHPVADARLRYEVGRAARIFAQLTAEPLEACTERP